MSKRRGRLYGYSGLLSAVLAVIAIVGVAGSVNCCLEYDTLVLTPDGLRAIGDLQPGDSITSVDPGSGAQLTSTVERVVHAMGWCRKLEVGEHSVWLTA